MSFSVRVLLIAAALLGQVGCGYFVSGTWVDDPGNWKRAFRSIKPESVTVVHSRYSRSPHWTLEFQYFFELAPNAELRDQLFSKNKLRMLSSEEAAKEKASHFGKPPTWFAPKPADNYEVWVYAQEPRGNFKVLIDKQTGNMFLSDYQI